MPKKNGFVMWLDCRRESLLEQGHKLDGGYEQLAELCTNGWECFDEEPPVKIEPVDLDYCQDDIIGSLEETEPAAFVHESQPILAPEIGNDEVKPATENDKQKAVRKTPKRKGSPVKKKSAKRTKNKKKLDRGDKQKLVESTSRSETSGYHPPSMLEEPQDVIIKPELDNPDHPSVDLPCPPTLQHYTDDEISSAFEQCIAAYGRATLKLKIADPGSLFGQVYTVLTNNNKSCLYERQYLHRIWLQKYKPESLKQFTEEQIGTGFLLCYNRKSKLNVNAPNSLFSKVYTFLTENKKSNCSERRYLFDLWTIKFKEALNYAERSRTSRIRRSSRAKVQRRLLKERKRDTLLQQTSITQPVGEYLSQEVLETSFQIEQDDDEIPPTFPQIPEEQEVKQIRIRVKVEVGVDDDCEAENIEYSSVTNDPSYEVASPEPLSPSPCIPESDYHSPEPPQIGIEDTDPKLTLKPVIRLTRFSARKLKQEEEELSKVKGQPENSLRGRPCRKSVRNKKYTGDDDSSVSEGASDDYIASGQEQNSNDDDTDYDLNSLTSVKNKITVSNRTRSRNASARALKRARGRPRIHPERVRKPRLKYSLLEKLVNWWHWGSYRTRITPDQFPIPVELWQESHGKHSEFIVSNTCGVLKEDVEKTAPTAGKGTFANPNWTYSDEGNENGRMGPLKCVCPACGRTFLEIEKLLKHRDKNHIEYLSMCVVCAKPIDRRVNMAPHLATHFTKDQLEELFEKEMTTMGPPQKGSFYRLHKCRKCHDIFVGAKRLYKHQAQCSAPGEYWNRQQRVVRVREPSRSYITKNPFSFVKKDTPSCISNCKVCRKPLSAEYMSLHLRTHFNFEEQKEYVRKQQLKLKNTNNTTAGKSFPGKDRTDVRIEQLKTLLEALERKNGKVITNWTKSKTNGNETRVTKKERRLVKRDGKYYYGPVQCATCGKVLAAANHLRRHEKAMHEGGLEKRFECSICYRPFARKDTVSSHIPTHFNLEEQEKFSVWTGSVWEFLERLNSGGDLSKPPTSGKERSKQIVMEYRRVRKKAGRPRKFHNLNEVKNVRESASEGGVGSQSESQPNFSAAAVASTLASSLTTAEVQSSALHWNADYAQVQQGQDALAYFELQNI